MNTKQTFGTLVSSDEPFDGFLKRINDQLFEEHNQFGTWNGKTTITGYMTRQKE